MLLPGSVYSQTPFYPGKTIPIIGVGEPGGAGDMRARTLPQNCQECFPGNSTILPPGTPRERVHILQEATRKAFQDPEFPKEYKKLAGDDPEVVMPEVLEQSLKELSRDPEVIELLKQLAGPGFLPRI